MKSACAIVDSLLETSYPFPDQGEQEKPEHYTDPDAETAAAEAAYRDSPEAYLAAQQARRASVKKIGVYGRRWWRRGAGGEYGKVYVYINDKHVWTSHEFGGGGDHYKDVACDWLRHNGWIELNHGEPLWYVRDQGIELDTSVMDVKRERDL